MSKPLNLKVDRHGDQQIVVSWDDLVSAQFSNSAGNLYGLLAGAVALGCLFLSLATMNPIWMLVAIVAVIVILILFKRSKPVRNTVEFTPQYVANKGRRYPTDEVTRIEYGLRSQLTGQEPAKDGHGNPMADPYIIRLWLNDTSAVTLSENNWQSQVNHEIRGHLDAALIAMKKGVQQRAHEEK